MDATTAKTFPRSLEKRLLSTAWRTERVPEVHDKHLADIVGRLNGATGQGEAGDLRRRTRQLNESNIRAGRARDEEESGSERSCDGVTRSAFYSGSVVSSVWRRSTSRSSVPAADSSSPGPTHSWPHEYDSTWRVSAS